MSLVIGFDLDLTLADSADGITATLVEAGRQVGAIIGPRELDSFLGLPLEEVLAHFVAEDKIPEAKALYRALYPEIGLPGTKILPGASGAVDAVHHHRGRVIVISAKVETTARALLNHLGLSVDDVVGERYAETKGAVLRERGADVFVGDHPGDMIGARSAGTYAMGVTTGHHDDVALRRAGADVVFSDLLDFPYWLDDFVGNPT